MVTKTVKTKATPKKKSAKLTSKKAVKPEEPNIDIIQTAKCPTVSNKSTLTYNVGVDDDKQIYIRIYGNSGPGFLSSEWISLENIMSILGEIPADQPISSFHLFPLFKGRSVNTPAFLLASLLNEGVLSLAQGKKRKYLFVGTDKLLTKLKKTKK